MFSEMRTWSAAILGVFLPLVSLSQPNPHAPMDPDLLLLARIKVVMSENLARLPDYTCLQTIERSRRQGPKRKFELQDTIRLEVAMVKGNELFSWPGAGKFEDRKISDIVGGGAIGNGNFGIHARSVFLGSAPVFEKAGEFEQNGRRLVRFHYKVARMNSGYHLRVGELEDIAGYYGSFEVDAETLDLVHLEVNASEIPPHLPLQSTRDVMRYARVNIGNSGFLLPESSELIMVALDGSESRNRTHFSSCRQYAGESVLRFDEPPAAEAPSQPAPVLPPVELEPGLLLELRLETPIRFGASSAGDQVVARLTNHLRSKGRVLVPKDALVRLRITRILKQPQGRGTVLVVALEATEIELAAQRVPVHAAIEGAGPILPGAAVKIDHENNAVMIDKLEIPRGFRTVWRILPASR
jgi:hypothetical protein